jgi:DVNP family
MKYNKNAHGHYIIKGHTYELLVGSRAQVLHKTAYKTTGGLTYNDLIQNKHGRIVSASKHRDGKNKNKNNLILNGYTAKKGRFGYVKIGSRKHHRGGNATGSSSSSSTSTNYSQPGSYEGITHSKLADNAGSVISGGRRRRGTRRHRIRGGIPMLGGSRHAPLSPADF